MDFLVEDTHILSPLLLILHRQLKQAAVHFQKTPVADYHSHTRCRGYKYNEFSEDDKFSNYIGQKPGYLVTPDGALLHYDPPPFSPSSLFSPNAGSITPIIIK